MAVYVKNNGSWVEAGCGQVKHEGEWKDVQEVWAKHEGVWKKACELIPLRTITLANDNSVAGINGQYYSKDGAASTISGRVQYGAMSDWFLEAPGIRFRFMQLHWASSPRLIYSRIRQLSGAIPSKLKVTVGSGATFTLSKVSESLASDVHGYSLNLTSAQYDALPKSGTHTIVIEMV